VKPVLAAFAAFAAAPAAPGPAPAEARPSLECDKGPLHRSFGGTAWRVYGCEDKETLVVAAAPGNPAAPFYFILSGKGESRSLYGEGTGERKATAPAFEDLKRLDEAAIAALVAATERAGAAAAGDRPGT
jgi:hypothetical protein